MRRLATFCFAFTGGILAAQYFLTYRLLPFTAFGCAVLGILWACLLHGDNRRRAVVTGIALAVALVYNWAYVWLVYAPYEEMVGTKQTVMMEAVDYPASTDYGCRIEVRILIHGLHGKAVYYGDSSLLTVEPGMRLRGQVSFNSSSSIHDTNVTTYTSRGIYSLLYGMGVPNVENASSGSLRYLPQRIARRMQQSISDCFPERTQAFMRAILLGDKYELDIEDKTNLSEAGLYHITAVSGLHCAFLLAILSVLIGRHRHRILSAFAIPVLVLYAMTVGLTPSVVRACIMLTFLLLGPIFRRESDPPTALSFALFLILLANPYAVKSVSLQLSFASVAGLLWLTPKLYERLRGEKRGRAAQFILGSLSATAGALVFTIPLSASYFGSLVLIAPLSNLLCLWAATLAFAPGLIVTILGMFLPAASRLMAFVPHFGALYVLTVSRYLAHIPYHALYFSGNLLRLWLLYVYAMLSVCLLFRRGAFRYAMAGGFAAGTLVLTVWLNTLPMQGGMLHMTALDIGQGQSVVLHSRNATALIDCGSSSFGDAGDITADHLQSVGIRSVDYIVLSHYHDDHCNGLPTLLARLKVGQLILPDIDDGDALRTEVLALAERYRIPVSFVHSALSLPLGEAVITVYPPVTESGDMNEECLSVLCSAGSFDALFTGDMDADSEYRLIATHELPDIEVLMAGHHGSRYSTGGDLLAEVRPETAVISCELGNRYGHPHVETLYRLADLPAKIYRTDLQGSIYITVH